MIKDLRDHSEQQRKISQLIERDFEVNFRQNSDHTDFEKMLREQSYLLSMWI